MKHWKSQDGSPLNSDLRKASHAFAPHIHQPVIALLYTSFVPQSGHVPRSTCAWAIALHSAIRSRWHFVQVVEYCDRTRPHSHLCRIVRVFVVAVVIVLLPFVLLFLLSMSLPSIYRTIGQMQPLNPRKISRILI